VKATCPTGDAESLHIPLEMRDDNLQTRTQVPAGGGSAHDAPYPAGSGAQHRDAPLRIHRDSHAGVYHPPPKAHAIHSSGRVQSILLTPAAMRLLPAQSISSWHSLVSACAPVSLSARSIVEHKYSKSVAHPLSRHAISAAPRHHPVDKGIPDPYILLAKEKVEVCMPGNIAGHSARVLLQCPTRY